MKNVFKGVFANDMLPKRINRNKDSAYVINSASSDGIGEHWLLVYVNMRSRTTIWFDSFGKSPEFYNKRISDWCKGLGYQIQANKKQIQASTSIYCGLYVLYVLYFLARGKRLPETTRAFSKHLLHNDKIVSKFMMHHFSFNAQKVLRKENLYKDLIEDYLQACKRYIT
jgi:hypothetical protein